MRCLALVLGVCLLFAGTVPERVARAYERQLEELAAVSPLAKLALRRHDGARPLGASLQLDPFAPVAAAPHLARPPLVVDVLHPTPPARRLAVHRSFDARGPPQAEES